MKSKLNTTFLLLLLFNLVPLYGVLYRGWTIFSVIYLFWIETLIASLFVFVRILYARGHLNQTPDMPREHPFLIGLRYLFLRVGLLLFYLLFIIIFVGLLASQKTDIAENFKIAAFMDPSFNVALMLFIMSQGYELWFDYIGKGEYLRKRPSELTGFIDARTIVMHVVIVLGAIGSEKMRSLFPGQERIADMVYISIFVVAKMIADIILYALKGKGIMEAIKKNQI